MRSAACWPDEAVYSRRFPSGLQAGYRAPSGSAVTCTAEPIIESLRTGTFQIWPSDSNAIHAPFFVHAALGMKKGVTRVVVPPSELITQKPASESLNSYVYSPVFESN